jgi:hypothetical protein
MTPLTRRLPQAEDPADAAVVDATLALLRGAHPRDGFEQRILTRLDDGPAPSSRFVPPLLAQTPFASVAFASAAFGMVAAGALGTAVFLAHNRPRPTVFIPTSPTPVLSQKVESPAVQPAGATAVPKSPIRPHTRGRSHRVGRAVHPRAVLPGGLPGGATSPRQVDLQAPQPLATHR